MPHIPQQEHAWALSGQLRVGGYGQIKMFFCGAEDVAIYTGRAGGLWVPPWESGSEGKHQFTKHMYLEYQSFNRGLEGITVGRKTHGIQ